MKIDEGFLAQMRRATQLLKSEGPMAATAAIQRALQGVDAATTTALSLPKAQEARDVNTPNAQDDRATAQTGGNPRARMGKSAFDKWSGAAGPQEVEDVEFQEASDLAGKGRFVSGTCTNQAGTRAYKLYIPSGYNGQALPLVVMLHGCKQHPDDFATGTGMNSAAEGSQCFVAYPAQSHRANGSNCWSWFNARDHRRDSGEASIIADITRGIISEYKIDASRIYVAGLSAGGAMATVMGATYPDLYAAIGVHSGLPYAVAHDVPSALAAMKNRHGRASANKGVQAVTPLGHTMPIIMFHGDRDATVDPSNGERAVAQCISQLEASSAKVMSDKVEKGEVPNGRTYTRTVLHDGQGTAIAEKWVVHGAGHAWSGGSNKGSYTDPKGPDATREMLRFFYTHQRSQA